MLSLVSLVYMSDWTRRNTQMVNKSIVDPPLVVVLINTISSTKPKLTPLFGYMIRADPLDLCGEGYRISIEDLFSIF